MPRNAGPYSVLKTADGISVPFYVLRFDEHGLSEGPLTQDQLIRDLENHGYTDVFLFSHGWNNDWTAAMDRYREFMTGYGTLRSGLVPVPTRRFRPLLAGVIWPSTDLVLPWEQGPRFAAVDSTRTDLEADAEQKLLRHLAEELPVRKRERFYELTERDELLNEEAAELIDMFPDLQLAGDEDLADVTNTSTSDMLEAWQEITAIPGERPSEAVSTARDWGTVETTTDTPRGPEAAGGLARFDPRYLVRMLTVRKMHDRAGVVGSVGVAKILRRILAAKSDARVHVVGHSYGARVAMSAISSDPDTTLPRNVDSALLLQPAVSHLCFSPNLPSSSKSGGFNIALDRVSRPILSTYSEHDTALHDVFHFVFTRRRDLGDLRVAAGGEPPNKWAALGGYGPWGEGLAATRVGMKDPGDRYDLNASTSQVIGIDGTAKGSDGKARIGSHGDIANEHTYWALHNLIES